jgi:hypothetical protein
MKTLYRVKLNTTTVSDDSQKDGYLASYCKIMEYTRGEALKKARMFDGKIEKAPLKVVKKQTYKIWLSIEELTVFTDGTEELKDFEGIDDIASIGKFNALGAARAFIENIYNTYGGE